MNLESVAREELVRSSVRDARSVASRLERFTSGLTVTVGFDGEEEAVVLTVEDLVSRKGYSLRVPVGRSKLALARSLRARIQAEREEAGAETYYQLHHLPDWFLVGRGA